MKREFLKIKFKYVEPKLGKVHSNVMYASSNHDHVVEKNFILFRPTSELVESEFLALGADEDWEFLEDHYYESEEKIERLEKRIVELEAK